MAHKALFVEGQTERIFVEDLILKTHQYTNLTLEGLRLVGNTYNNERTSYPDDYPTCGKAASHYLVVDVGNDERVKSVILARQEGIWDEGYQQIIGLRDMYSEAYEKAFDQSNLGKKLSKRTVDLGVVSKFLKEGNSFTPADHPSAGTCHLSFAIMELETWFLAMPDVLSKALGLDVNEVNDIIQSNTDQTFDEFDYQFVHPADILDKIYGKAGKSYGKKESQVKSIVSHIRQEDYENLYLTGVSASFCAFYELLFDL